MILSGNNHRQDDHDTSRVHITYIRTFNFVYQWTLNHTLLCLGAPFLLQLGAPKHRSVWLSYLNLKIESVYSNKQC